MPLFEFKDYNTSMSYLFDRPELRSQQFSLISSPGFLRELFRLKHKILYELRALEAYHLQTTVHGHLIKFEFSNGGYALIKEKNPILPSVEIMGEWDQMKKINSILRELKLK